jgi:hypothetical protein
MFDGHSDISVPLVNENGWQMRFSAILSTMKAGQCYQNVLKLWKRQNHGGLTEIAVGYGLSLDDGLWRPHAWGLRRAEDQTHIIETTEIRDAYFGISAVSPEAEFIRVCFWS